MSKLLEILGPYLESDAVRAYAAAFAIGVSLHAWVLRYGEWDTYSLRLFATPFAVPAVLTAAMVHLRPDRAMAATTGDALRLDAALLGGVLASMLVYRAFLHRLSGFPGPFAARLSKLYMMRQSLRLGQRPFDDVRRLHAAHGDFVRLGPAEVSVVDPLAFRAVHANSTRCTKGIWYSIGEPHVNLHMTRDRKEHAHRRKLWDQAFSSKALSDYEGRVRTYTGRLVNHIDENQGRPFNVTEWFNCYTFDIMGDLAFGEDFAMMQRYGSGAGKHYFYHTVHQQMDIIGIFGHVPWIFPMLKTLPVVNWAYVRFIRWATQQIQKRLDSPPDVPDVFHWVTSEYKAIQKPTWKDTQNLIGDVGLIVVAGSDTTATTLTCLFYQLARHPEALGRLRDEVDALVAEKGGDVALLDNAALTKLDYLQACIDESLRLNPVVPMGVQRKTPPEGAQLGTRWVPGDTTVVMPSWIMYRDERSFPRGEEFIPERWTTRPELVRDATIYAPFSTGRFSCVGKQLALMEIRRTTALILHGYDLSIAPGQDVGAFTAKMRDTFTLVAPDFNLVFKSRGPR